MSAQRVRSTNGTGQHGLDEQKDVLLIDVVGVPWFSTRRLRYLLLTSIVTDTAVWAL
jgi:hypothetical protein